MSQKRSIDSVDEKDSDGKRPRKSLTLELKLAIINRIELGERQSEVCRALNLAGSTVRTIYQNRDKIKECGKVSTSLNALRLIRTRAPIMVEMERLLSVWIEENTPATLLQIQERARSIYEQLKSVYPLSPDAEPFTASKGWFERFKKRSSSRTSGARDATDMSDSNIIDAQTAYDFKKQIIHVAEEEDFTPRQVFSVNETDLFWKKLPAGCYVSDSDLKVSNERLCVLIGGNAAGDFKLKPLLVYHTENPVALNGYVKGRFPVIWRANKRASMTMSIFQSWFSDYFCPAVEKYCATMNLPNKALLILDSSPEHPPTLEDLSANVKVLFMPSNITKELQPMLQGAQDIFKTHYIQKLFSQAVRVTDEESGPNFQDFWKSYNIRQAIDNISSAWDEVSSTTMNVIWRNLWKKCVKEFLESYQTLTSIQEDIVELGIKLGFYDLEPQDIQQLINSQSDELTSDDLLEVEVDRALENLRADEDEHETARVLTAKGMAEAFKHLESFCSYFHENDPDMERSLTVRRAIENQITCYRHLYDEKKKSRGQPSIGLYRKKNSSHLRKPGKKSK